MHKAGFGEPRLFVDGIRHPGEHGYDALGLDVTCRFPVIKTWGNWYLALGELFIREPQADRFAIFQDDLATYPNLRQYLESVEMAPRTYWNLYTTPANEAIVPRDTVHNLQVDGWHKSNQCGRGAVCLMFDREGVLAVLSSREHVVERPLYADRGTSKVDGAVVDALRKVGWTEMIHHPSLVQHLGDLSSMGNRQTLKAMNFRGEDFDAASLIR